MRTRCKFCGRKINSTHYLTPVERSCTECVSYCMRQCPEAAKCSTSWHKEPCVSCAHNPYHSKYVWDSGQWVKITEIWEEEKDGDGMSYDIRTRVKAERRRQHER